MKILYEKKNNNNNINCWITISLFNVYFIQGVPNKEIIDSETNFKEILVFMYIIELCDLKSINFGDTLQKG